MKNMNIFKVGHVKTFILFSAKYTYQKSEQSDCLVGNDLHHLYADSSPDHINCQEWCSNNETCGGFTFFHSCYFKIQACSSEIITADHAVLYLKKGL